MKPGKVYLVGAGPGDPKLLTLYGLECIQKSDVIAYDRLVNPKLLDYAKDTAELIFCGKLPGKHHLIQDEIHELLVNKAMEGKTVTRLKGGDPFIFGRGGEEAEVLVQHGIPYEVVPGVTAGIAASAYAGIPVTHRDHATSFAIVTGHGRADKGADHLNWSALATGIDTVAFYMGVGNLAYISKQLIAHGRNAETPVAIIERGTMEKQRTITGTLETIVDVAAQEKIENPAMILVGQVVQLRDKIQWYEQMVEENISNEEKEV